MLVPAPHRYSATIRRTLASRARVEAPPAPALPGGPATDGDAAAWSPEHLLLSSAGLCMLTTFEALAARADLEVLAWSAQVHGTVERTPDGPMFASIVLCLDLDVAGRDEAATDDGRLDERVLATLEEARQACLVLNSLRVPVVVEASVHTTATLGASTAA